MGSEGGALSLPEFEANYESFKNFPEHLNFPIYDRLLHSNPRRLAALPDPSGAAGGREPALLTPSGASYLWDPLITTFYFLFEKEQERRERERACEHEQRGREKQK